MFAENVDLLTTAVSAHSPSLGVHGSGTVLRRHPATRSDTAYTYLKGETRKACFNGQTLKTCSKGETIKTCFKGGTLKTYFKGKTRKTYFKKKEDPEHVLQRGDS